MQPGSGMVRRIIYSSI